METLSVKIDIDISGIEEFAEKMARLDTSMQVEVHEALQIGANLIKADAQAYAPYRTGFLRSTIYAVAKFTWVFKIGAWAGYAKYQEYGTRYIRAVRFLSRAIQGRWPEIRDLIDRALLLARMEAEL